MKQNDPNRHLLVLLLVVCVVGLACSLASLWQTESTYPTAGAVISVDRSEAPESYLVTVRTYTGHEYAFESDGDWLTGDLAAMTMNDKGTPDDVTDDEITAVRYVGYGDPETW